MEKHSYNLSLEWTGDRKGILSSPEFPSTVEVVTPPEFDKGIAGHWSPEHLFTASVLSCFMTTFLAIADYSMLEYEKFECKAEGILESIEGKFLMTEIILKPIVYIKNQEEIEKTERILHKSEKACLISNSIISNVVLDFEVKVV
jgi:peroxiredoxin-like protein